MLYSDTLSICDWLCQIEGVRLVMQFSNFVILSTRHFVSGAWQLPKAAPWEHERSWCLCLLPSLSSGSREDGTHTTLRIRPRRHVPHMLCSGRKKNQQPFGYFIIIPAHRGIRNSSLLPTIAFFLISVICCQCLEMVSSEQGTLRKHIITDHHSAAKSLLCSDCGFVAHSKRVLETHVNEGKSF